MDENMLQRLSMVITIIGLISLILILKNNNLSEYNSLTSKEEDNVILIGNITELRDIGSGYYVTVSYDEKISFYLDYKHSENLKKFDKVNITGEVSIFNGKKTLSVYSIT